MRDEISKHKYRASSLRAERCLPGLKTLDWGADRQVETTVTDCGAYQRVPLPRCAQHQGTTASIPRCAVRSNTCKRATSSRDCRTVKLISCRAVTRTASVQPSSDCGIVPGICLKSTHLSGVYFSAKRVATTCEAGPSDGFIWPHACRVSPLSVSTCTGNSTCPCKNNRHSLVSAPVCA